MSRVTWWPLGSGRQLVLEVSVVTGGQGRMPLTLSRLTQEQLEREALLRALLQLLLVSHVPLLLWPK